MGKMRHCSRSACPNRAVATLTYVYADSTAVLGPLAIYAEPHSYDLCAVHAEKLTVPRGWEVVRLAMPDTPVEQHPDDLLALADAVREAARKEEHAQREAEIRAENNRRISPAPIERPEGVHETPRADNRKRRLRVVTAETMEQSPDSE